MKRVKQDRKLKNLKKPRLHWYTGKLNERVFERKDDPRKLRKRWKSQRNREF